MPSHVDVTGRGSTARRGKNKTEPCSIYYILVLYRRRNSSFCVYLFWLPEKTRDDAWVSTSIGCGAQGKSCHFHGEREKRGVKGSCSGCSYTTYFLFRLMVLATAAVAVVDVEHWLWLLFCY